MVEPCFEDPAGSALALDAASSQASVVAAHHRGENVVFSGVSPGEATITVTATNEGELTAETSFSVLVPNRAPEFVSDLRDIRLPVTKSREWNLLEFFTERDGEEMTFTATSSNNASVNVTVRGSVAEVLGVSEGEAQVTITATDPHGAEATGTIDVTVAVPVVLFEDGFDSEASLDDWTASFAAKLSVEGGALHVEPLYDAYYGASVRATDPVEDYSIEVTLKPVAGGSTGVTWLTGHDTGDKGYSFVTGEFTDGRNWRFQRFRGEVLFGGNSSAIGLDEYQNYTISLSGGDLLISVEGEELLAETIENAPPAMEEIRLMVLDVKSEYDFVRVSGLLDEDRGANTRTITRPPLDTRIKR